MSRTKAKKTRAKKNVKTFELKELEIREFRYSLGDKEIVRVFSSGAYEVSPDNDVLSALLFDVDKNLFTDFMTLVQEARKRISDNGGKFRTPKQHLDPDYDDDDDDDDEDEEFL